MGAWGHKLYDSDTASDIRDSFKDWSRLPYGGEELLRFALSHHPDAEDPGSEDHSVFWLVMADLFYRYGIVHAPLFERAVSIIDQGIDARIMRDLDMEEGDLKRRARELQALKAKWAAPNPKPVKRKMFKEPEPHAVEPGEIWIYPTADGNPPNTYFSAADIEKEFKPDGWNAMAVGNVGHQLGFFALAYMMRLHVESREKPDFETCRRAPISGVHYFIMDEDAPLAHGVSWAVVSKNVLKKMRAEKIGKADLSWDKIRARLNGTDELETSNRARVSGLFSVYQRMIGTDDYMDYAAPLDIKLTDLMA